MSQIRKGRIGMDKKLVMAVAGSGKTYMLCNTLDSEKRNLILAFTHENIKNIHFELMQRFRAIPENTTVSTFHGFVYGDCVQPYHRAICTIYGEQHFGCEGVTFSQPPKPMNATKYNYMYIKESKLRHYIPGKRYFCSRMAKLVYKNEASLLPAVLARINKFYDALFIDEYQDYRNEEYELLSAIIRGFNGDVLLTGDYYQHSVSGDNNTGKPFGTAQKPVNYQNYKKTIEKLGITLDETTLSKSRRCSKSVCEFVKSKLGVGIESDDEHDGDVIVISDTAEAEQILNDDRVCKLLLRDSAKYSFVCFNWSYSKGDTYLKTCVILTENTSNLIDNGFRCDQIAPTTKNKLYVALTRSQTSVHLMTKVMFDAVKDKYLK
jgi:DNA helicase-2/ATP-dependent DNA helicase PcrA